LLGSGSDLVVATSAKPQAWQRSVEDCALEQQPMMARDEMQDVQGIY